MAPFLSLRVAVRSRKGFKSKSRAKHGKMRGTKELRGRVERLKTEMEKRSEERKDIRERQRQVKDKVTAIEAECEELKRETRFIVQQTARTQIKLGLMFRILKARETGHLDEAALLTQMLREIVRFEEEEEEKKG
ncbi:hypothetical protein E1A91_D02G280300v1 [Gossypium mustelinum]|uniref:Uncharacterized protein n=2 Tax=Gossypium TaxID=3633 RepID=A0A5D2W1D5_GOSMU|nr:hypothetical protein ES288_D02G291700v1 [Gossypium darwinii]TYI95445.1 hypothetical protein E1A91_D02G280300v1 [Gossypium mustelinum]